MATACCGSSSRERGRRIGLLEPLPVYPPALALATIEYAPTRVLDQVKSLSYAANMLVDRLAKERDADLALLITPHGRILEAATSSFFCALDDTTLVTPPLSEHILDSITRRRLLELVDVEERPLTRDEIPQMTEAFLASTTREVHPIRSIDQIELPAAPGPTVAGGGNGVQRACRRLAVGTDAGPDGHRQPATVRQSRRRLASASRSSARRSSSTPASITTTSCRPSSSRSSGSHVPSTS